MIELLRRQNYAVDDLASKDWSTFSGPDAPELTFVFTLCDQAAAETCPVCAGKRADGPMCALFDGVLTEAVHWITGRDFAVREVQCRAMGAEACVWEIAKTARQTTDEGRRTKDAPPQSPP